MGLRDIEIPTAPVKVADAQFSVRGLSPNDALGLYYRHTGQLSALFDEFTERHREGLPLNAADATAAILAGAPRIMAEIIALASDSDPSNELEWGADLAVALRLPAGVQADALNKIGELTFTSDMPPPKFFGLVVALARSTQAATLSPTSGNGSGVSVGR